MRIGKTAEHSANAFDFLRLCAALAVLFSHSYALFGLSEPEPVGSITLGTVALYGFFAISGFLVCQSWDRDPDSLRFAIRRGLRIMPGLLVAVVVTTFLIGSLATTMSPRSYLASPEVWQYFVSNAGLVAGRETLPGVFATNPYPGAVNGSLWTLRYEVLMYALLAIGGLAARGANQRWACVVTLAVLVAMGGMFFAANVNTYNLALPGLWRIGLEFDLVRLSMLGTIFFASSCLYLFRSKLVLSVPIALLLCIACALVPPGAFASILLWISVPYVTLVAAYRAPHFLSKVGKRSDLSYGIYIYAFPLQQLTIGLLAPVGMRWAATLIGSLLVTIVFATLSWHLVERPALDWKTRLTHHRIGPDEVVQQAIATSAQRVSRRRPFS